MRFMRPAVVLATLVIPLGVLDSGQQAAQQVSPALAVLQQAVVAMGGTAPSDSTANGTITTVAGSLTENGNVVILTRGTDQSSEQIQTPSGFTVIYSRGEANQDTAASVQILPLERAVTCQGPEFPLPLLAGAIANQDTAYSYVGLETLNGLPVHHIQFWNSFASSPKLQQFSGFSVRDIWIDAASGLPQQLSYQRRDGGGATPAIQFDAFYSDYRIVGGVLYPFSIQESVNGTPWATITIQSVAFNTGLTDANFQVQ